MNITITLSWMHLLIVYGILKFVLACFMQNKKSGRLEYSGSQTSGFLFNFLFMPELSVLKFLMFSICSVFNLCINNRFLLWSEWSFTPNSQDEII